MNHMLGFAQLLDLDPLDPEQKDSVDQILNSGDRLLALIDRILQASQVLAHLGSGKTIMKNTSAYLAAEVFDMTSPDLQRGTFHNNSWTRNYS